MSGFFKVLSCVILVCVTASCSIFSSDGNEERIRHLAYSWSKPDSKLGNIIPFVWIRYDSKLEDIKKQADQLPEGSKVLFSWDLHRGLQKWQVARLEKKGVKISEAMKYGINNHPDDTPILWDKGVEIVAKRFDDFFKRYKKIGGKMDCFVLDFEQGMSNWHFRDKAKVMAAINNDPKSAAIIAKLGFRDLSKVFNWRSGDDYLRWNAAMGKRVAEYVDQAIYLPIKKYYPNVRMSNYGPFHYSSAFKLPDVNGHKIYKYGYGAHSGTDQSPSLYCGVGGVSLLSLDGKVKYAKTPFNGFRFSVNRLRTAVLSSRVPVRPWIANKDYSGMVKNSDYYQELIFHAALTGIDRFLFWNPLTFNKKTRKYEKLSRETDNKILNDCLCELDSLAGVGPQKTFVSNLVPWDAHYVLTGMRMPKKSIWRYTPDMGSDEKISDYIISENPLTLKTRGGRIVVAGGSVIKRDEKLSNRGLWFEASTNCSPKLILDE